MNFPNPKAQTVKIPRKQIPPADQEQALDVLLACAYPSASPSNKFDRDNFERDIMNATNSEMSPRIKQTLAGLTEEEKRLLFQ